MRRPNHPLNVLTASRAFISISRRKAQTAKRFKNTAAAALCSFPNNLYIGRHVTADAADEQQPSKALEKKNALWNFQTESF
jgi:hypothetical protein